MVDRIKKIMEEEHLTPSAFADLLNIGRATLSHILNGRNNASLDVVTRILETMDYINSDWLLLGKGDMRRRDSDMSQSPLKPLFTDVRRPVDLFDNVDTIEDRSTQHASTSTEPINNKAIQAIEEDTTVVSKPNKIDIPESDSMLKTDRQVSRIIIYYTDSTFQAFNPDNSFI